MALLALSDVSVSYHTGGGTVHAVNNVSLRLEKGETLGLVGESGCGKSTLAAAILGLLPHTARATGGSIDFAGRDLLRAGPAEIQAMRWTRLAYVPQGAVNSLDPVTTIRRQMAKIWRRHKAGAMDGFSEAAERLFRRVELDARWLDAYPHELSGGMRQRAIIAIALMFEPQLLIADEPTTGLDVIVQRQVLNVLRQLQDEEEMSVVFVSHDIAVIVEMCRTLAVMYAGEIMEMGATRDVLNAPAHPYTMGLRRAFPDIRQPDMELISIPGSPPRLDQPTKGCPFTERCPFAEAICVDEKPPLAVPPGGSHPVACHFADRAGEMRARAADPTLWKLKGDGR